ncbi:transketolase [Nocardioidaceae bacterium]|nr:transketolase [Nocardioidaceae bacterium]
MSIPSPLKWTDLDDRIVNTVRGLAMDSVQKKGNGHPGTAVSLAPVMHMLFQKVMRHDPTDPGWIARDRFVLSCGHSSISLYNQLYLGGFGLELEDLKSLRTWGSKTPGHPELGYTAGVETTTGPLGQGIGNAVGMAMAQRRLKGMLDPNAGDGASPFDHHVYCLASDGDIEEGVSAEASSLAGTQRLGNLTLIYDKNQISIEDDTSVALSEDVAARYEAYGWHVQRVDWTTAGEDGGYKEDVQALHDALKAAEADERPSFIELSTIISWPSPNLQNTGDAHGSALGEDEVKATKELIGLDPGATFAVSDDVLESTRGLQKMGREARDLWQADFEDWKASNPDGAAILDRLSTHSLPDGWDADLPTYEAGKGVASRKASGEAINAIAAHMPEFWGGSADLAGSNKTTIDDATSFIPKDRSSDMFTADPYAGRVLHFGIREHGMGAVLNGISAHSGTRVFGATFLVFSDYMRPSVRLASLMKLPVTYVWTHDSIGLGEDGPTHQPVEHLASLRAIPRLSVVRPADGNETSAAWKAVMEHTDGPSGLVLSRQDLPTFPRGEDGFVDAAGMTEGVKRGAYTLVDAEDGQPDVVLVATGSEVQLAVEAREQLAADGVSARVVSMPCREWFFEQDPSYRDQVIPPQVKARVSVEAGVSLGWREIVGDHGRSVSLEHYGASAAYEKLYEEFGITTAAVVAAAQDSLAAART